MESLCYLTGEESLDESTFDDLLFIKCIEVKKWHLTNPMDRIFAAMNMFVKISQSEYWWQ